MSNARKPKRTDGVAADGGALPYYTQAGVAALAGVTRFAVNAAIRRGQIRTVPTIDGVPLVAREEAERWLAERRPAHRPKSDQGEPSTRSTRATTRRPLRHSL